MCGFLLNNSHIFPAIYQWFATIPEVVAPCSFWKRSSETESHRSKASDDRWDDEGSVQFGCGRSQPFSSGISGQSMTKLYQIVWLIMKILGSSCFFYFPHLTSKVRMEQDGTRSFYGTNSPFVSIKHIKTKVKPEDAVPTLSCNNVEWCWMFRLGSACTPPG